MEIFLNPAKKKYVLNIKKYNPQAVLGVCCYEEANMAFDRLRGTNIYPQAVMLLQDGCKDTKANVAEVKEKMMLIDKKIENRPS